MRRSRETKAAHKRRNRERLLRHKARIDAIKLERGCIDCGFRGHPAALDFDHLPDHKKQFGISDYRLRPWRVIQAEIEKCEIVCANCHRVRTVTRGLWHGVSDEKPKPEETLPLFEQRGSNADSKEPIS